MKEFEPRDVFPDETDREFEFEEQKQVELAKTKMLIFGTAAILAHQELVGEHMPFKITGLGGKNQEYALNISTALPHLMTVLSQRAYDNLMGMGRVQDAEKILEELASHRQNILGDKTEGRK